MCGVTEALVIGGDCGGTSTRVVVATLDGDVVGRGRGGAGNPVARPPAEAAAALAGAVREALGDLDPGRVVGAVVGVAGYGRLALPEVTSTYAAAWAATGVRCPLTAVGDAVVAFAAGSTAPSGSVLIAGTGAIACRITDWRVTDRADGLGWLLGDEGSGFWFGVAAARLTARTLHATGAGEPARFPRHDLPATPGVAGGGSSGGGGDLVRAVHAAVGGADADAFVSAFYALARDKVAALAPLVFAAAEAGDPAASSIVAEGADRLAATLLSLPPSGGPVVLAGGLLTAVPTLRAAVEARLPTSPPPTTPTTPPSHAAARLAAKEGPLLNGLRIGGGPS